jgi:hypothetical protein
MTSHLSQSAGTRRGRFGGEQSGQGEDVSALYVAILDYQPDAASSRSGHRQLELALKEGDQVRVRGVWAFGVLFSLSQLPPNLTLICCLLSIFSFFFLFFNHLESTVENHAMQNHAIQKPFSLL